MAQRLQPELVTVQTVSPQRLGRVFWQLWVPLVVLLFWIFRDISFTLSTEFFIALGIAALSLMPGFIWAYRDTRELPAFPLFCLIHFPYYAYPILAAKPAYMSYPERARVLASLNVLVFLGAGCLIYYWPGRKRRKAANKLPRLALRRIPDRVARKFFRTCLLVWLMIVIASHFGWLNWLGRVQNVAWTLGNAAGIVSIFFLFRLMGAKLLSHTDRVLLISCVTIGILVSCATGFLIGGTSIMMIAILGYALGKGRIPWLAGILCLSLVGFLHVGKAQMRQGFWRPGTQGVTLSVGKVIDIYEVWIPASWRQMPPVHLM